MTAPEPQTPVGTPVHLDFTKYDGSPHWQEPYDLLGVDEHGVWLAMGTGTTYARPGRTITSKAPSVRLVPHVGRWAAIFNAPGPGVKVHTYVDITDQPQWERSGPGFRARLVDLDLDVVRRFRGNPFIDDMDEFHEHRVSFGYPDSLVEQVRADAFAVLEDVRGGREPFGNVGQEWLGRLVRQDDSPE